MTRRDVDSLLRDWDEVARTARTPAPALRPGRVRARESGLSVVPLLVVAVVVVAGFAVFARSVGGPGVGATPGASAAGPVIGSVDDGTLKLSLSADRGTYAEGDPIAAAATLEYIGPGTQLTVYTALDQVVFSVSEVGGDRQAGGGARQSCNLHTLTRGEPVPFPWAKFAAYSPGDPGQAFAEWYATTGPTLRLPAGTWRLSATFEGAEGGCGNPDHTLTAEVVVTVQPVTADASPAGVPTPAPSPPYAGPSNVVTCGRFEPFACGGVLMLLAADHAEELSAASRIVVDDVCPPDAICDMQYPFTALVVVIPPEGIEAAVTYLVTGKDGPEVARTSTEAIPIHIAAQATGPGTAPEPIPLLNLDAPPSGTPGPCAAALIDGRLVADPVSGLAIGVDGAGGSSVITVRWPFGYTARVDALGYALVDDVGATIAHVGDRLRVGGGFAENDVWGACSGVFGVGGTLIDP